MYERSWTQYKQTVRGTLGDGVSRMKDQTSPDQLNQEPPAEEVEALDLEDAGKTNQDDWVGRAAMMSSGREEALLGKIWQLGLDAARSLQTAKDCLTPKALKRNLRNAVQALEALLLVVRELDDDRRQNYEKMDFGAKEEACVHAWVALLDERLARSDQMIADLLLEGIELLDRFVARCRAEAAHWRGRDPRELLIRCGMRRIGPDRRSWEEDYMGLAAWLAKQTSKLRQAVSTRSNKLQGTRLAETGKARSPAPERSELKSGLDRLVAAVPGFFIAKTVKKARTETLH